MKVVTLKQGTSVGPARTPEMGTALFLRFLILTSVTRLHHEIPRTKPEALALTVTVRSLLVTKAPAQAAALYFGIPFVGACYAYFYFKYGRQKAQLSKV